MGSGVKIALDILIIIITGVGLYYALKYQVKKNTEDIKELSAKLDEHCKQTPICMKKFEEIKIDFNKLTVEENMKTQYQKQMVTEILTPVMKEMNENILKYIDLKITAIESESREYKSYMNNYLREFKDENNKQIERLIEVLKNKK